MTVIRLCCILCPFLLLFVVHGQVTTRKEPPRSQIEDPEVAVVVGMARGAPPEFAADVLLTLVETGLVPERRFQRDLLLESFDAAAHAQEPVALSRVESGVYAGPIYAFARGIDQISLRARIVRAFLKFDPVKAHDLFQRIDLPLDGRPQCEDTYSFDLSLYYSVMSAVLDSMTSHDEREEMLRSHLQRFKSVAQIMPFVTVLSTVKGGPAHFPDIVVAFTSLLAGLDKDRQTFSSDFVASIVGLQTLASALPPYAREYLIQQARRWVLDGVNNGMCGHRQLYSIGPDGKRTPVEWAGPIDLFNRRLAGLSLTKPPPIIEQREIKDAPQVPPAPDEAYSPEYQRYRRLRYLLADEGEEAQDSSRWKNEMEKYITLLIEWKSTGQDPSKHYLEKAELLSRVLRMQKYSVKATGSSEEALQERLAKQHAVPQAAILGRDRLMLAITQFFDGEVAHDVFRTRRIVWFTPVREALRGDVKTENVSTFAELFAMYSRHPVLNLYGRLALLMAEHRNR
jgi:hypothetical protein